MAEENAELEENNELEAAATPVHTPDSKSKVAKPKKEGDVSVVLMIGGALGAVVLIIVSAIIGTVIANRIFPPYIIEMPAPPPPVVEEKTDDSSKEKKKKKKLESTEDDDDDDDEESDGSGSKLLGHHELYTFKSDKVTTNVKGSTVIFGQLTIAVNYKLLYLDELSDKGFITGYTKPASNVQFDDYDNNYYDDVDYYDYYEKFKNNEKNKGKSKNDYKKSNNKNYIRNISYDYSSGGIQIVPVSYSYNANYHNNYNAYNNYNANYYNVNDYNNYNDNNYANYRNAYNVVYNNYRNHNNYNAYNNYKKNNNYNNDYFIMNTSGGGGEKKEGGGIEINESSKLYLQFKQTVMAKLNDFVGTHTSEELQAMRPDLPKILQELLQPIFKEYGLKVMEVQVIQFLVARN